ncbi:hypothetical protein TorRG33x02_214400 [Trema orientale]|uniref:Uncharacterized protein n=1 Tax=Trema orientale TaxID=63057 RepID=A0A2P5EAY4_TREOI|nr:hypothetical protein TorRG33x02_214400 [Trema orientale]
MPPFSPSGSASAALSSYHRPPQSRNASPRTTSFLPTARASSRGGTSSSWLNTFLDTRRDEIKRLLCTLSRISSQHGFAKVELKTTTFSELTFNVIVRMVAGKRYFGDEVSDVEEADRAV